MIKHGTAPFLECSSRGDRRLSALYAQIRGRDHQTIESLYQTAKVLRDGSTPRSVASGKGKRAVNQAECRRLYSRLWDEYIAENPDLLELIRSASGLSDFYGRPGHACQASELWRIRGFGHSSQGLFQGLKKDLLD